MRHYDPGHRRWHAAHDGQPAKPSRQATVDREFQDHTLLVVGLGSIGTEVGRLAHALGMRVIATRNSSNSGPAFVDYVGFSDEMYALAGEADVAPEKTSISPGR